MRKASAQWLESAEMDLGSIDQIIQRADLTPVAAFHSQQCVEKCFKAVLEEYSQMVPREHSTLKLYGLVLELIPLEVDREILTDLDDLYIEARYPGELGLLPDGKPARGCSTLLQLRPKPLSTNQTDPGGEALRALRLVLTVPDRLLATSSSWRASRASSPWAPPSRSRSTTVASASSPSAAFPWPTPSRHGTTPPACPTTDIPRFVRQRPYAAMRSLQGRPHGPVNENVSARRRDGRKGD